MKKIRVVGLLIVTMGMNGCLSRTIAVNASHSIHEKQKEKTTPQKRVLSREISVIPLMEEGESDEAEANFYADNYHKNGCEAGKCLATNINIPECQEKRTPLWKRQSIESVERPQIASVVISEIDKEVEREEQEVSQNIYHMPIISSNIAVQVGAFRKYAGAKVYAKRYSLLNSQYDVKIRKDYKDLAPLYRVRVHGFSSAVEAKRFISEYGSEGAFLVRK